jgi:hypothetical protein
MHTDSVNHVECHISVTLKQQNPLQPNIKGSTDRMETYHIPHINNVQYLAIYRKGVADGIF